MPKSRTGGRWSYRGLVAQIAMGALDMPGGIDPTPGMRRPSTKSNTPERPEWLVADLKERAAAKRARRAQARAASGGDADAR